MKRKEYIVTIVIFSVLLLLLTAADLIKKDRFFSSNENRILASSPEFSWKSLFFGNYTEEYEDYVTDQFIGRDGWIRVKTDMELLLQKKDVNGVYLGKDGYLIEKHDSSSIDMEQADKKMERLKQDIEEYERLLSGGTLKVMLIPTADMILTEKLPAFAEDFDQLAYSSRVGSRLVPTAQTLQAHNQEPVYYKTDHHWTTLGAYYGYEAWAASMGIEAKSINAYHREIVSENFLGTLHSKLNSQAEPDTIELFLPKEPKQYEVYYDLSKEATDTLYEKKYLDTKNQYGIFLDDNHGLIEIKMTPAEEEKTLLIVKDSYANCLVPFLTEHYSRIFVLDKRYYRGDIGTFLEENNIQDFLILYDVIHFIQNY